MMVIHYGDGVIFTVAVCVTFVAQLAAELSLRFAFHQVNKPITFNSSILMRSSIDIQVMSSVYLFGFNITFNKLLRLY